MFPWPLSAASTAPVARLGLRRAGLSLLGLAALALSPIAAAPRPAAGAPPLYPSYEGRVLCGYQGWFRAEGDGSGKGWSHYGTGAKFDAESVKVDLWPEVSEYARTYATPFTLPDGRPARVFSSWDASTIDVHFRWMKEHGIDGVFLQRFFQVTRTERSRAEGRILLGQALEASRRHGRAFAVMYDLSGLKANGEDCASVIQDWKELVDNLRLTALSAPNTYLHHRGKPLVAIWGLGFPDRPYDIRRIGIDRLIDFLKNDPVYGGCSVMLGVPTYFRALNVDTLPDPYLHEIMARADVIMPWTVQRFTPLLHNETARYRAQVAADLAWCQTRGLDYAACVYPGFSWYNLGRHQFGGRPPLDQIPRQGGRFYWELITAAHAAGARMLYVAMFDEIDEGTAIFKCAAEPPRPLPPARFVAVADTPSDHYLWLTGQAGRLLRGALPTPVPELFRRTDPATRDAPAR